MKILVVGSGPSGIAAISKLIDKGFNVTLIDGFGAYHKKIHSVNDCIRLTLSQPLKTFKKLNKGSDFYFKSFLKQQPINATEVTGIHGSLISGGLGNLWGAAVKRYSDNDMVGWPFTSSTLSKYYDFITSIIDVCSLHNINPYTKNYTHKGDKTKIEIESSCIAFRKEGLEHCSKCGLCAYGCPDNLIFNPGDYLENLISKNTGRILHIRDRAVIRFDEKSDEIKVYVKNLINGAEEIFSFDRIFIGAGTISTTNILINSMNIFSQDINMKCSQYFFVPVFNFGSVLNNIYTLAHYFIKIGTRKLFDSHIQLYLYPNILSSLIQKKLKFVFFDKLINRIGFIQGYLHSNESSSFTISVKDKGGAINLIAINNKKSKFTIRHVLLSLKNALKDQKIILLLPFLKIGAPGEGNHYGGTFPMKNSNESEFYSDRKGRPNGFKRVHIIDSTVFPSIPSKPITFSVMANAARIADEASE